MLGEDQSPPEGSKRDGCSSYSHINLIHWHACQFYGVHTLHIWWHHYFFNHKQNTVDACCRWLSTCWSALWLLAMRAQLSTYWNSCRRASVHLGCEQSHDRLNRLLADWKWNQTLSEHPEKACLYMVQCRMWIEVVKIHSLDVLHYCRPLGLSAHHWLRPWPWHHFREPSQ